MENITELKTTGIENDTVSRAQYEELLAKFSEAQSNLKEAQSSNESLKARVEWLEQVIKSANKNRYGAKSEKITGDISELMKSLFNEAEVVTAVSEAKETSEDSEEGTVVKEHIRRKRQAKEDLVNNLPKDTPVEVIEHYLEDNHCPNCGSEMEIIGKKEVKHVAIIPSQVKLIVDIYYTYACKSCIDYGNNETVVEAPREKQVLPGSYAAPESIAHLMVQKFVMGSPLYRMEQEFSRQQIPLSRQTMSNWMLSASERWLQPIYDELHRRLLKQEVLHCDETPVQVLHEPGRRPQSKSYMWVYRTSGCTEHPIVLFKYEPSRSGDCPQRFLKGFQGYLHSDGYEAYHNLGPDVINVGCLVHARRKFYDLIKDKSGAVNQTAAKAVGYFTKIANIEKRLAALTFEERHSKRQELEKPVLDDLFAWAEKVNVAPKSKLGEAFTYLRNQRKYLVNYLLDGRLETTNNRAERTIKPFVIDRKNFLFANTPKGADGSAIMFSLIETAKENKLDPFRYLTYVFKLAPNLDQTQSDWIAPLLPENAPDECKIHRKQK